MGLLQLGPTPLEARVTTRPLSLMAEASPLFASTPEMLRLSLTPSRDSIDWIIYPMSSARSPWPDRPPESSWLVGSKGQLLECEMAVTGTINKCYKWYTVKSGDTCANIESDYDINLAAFQALNTYIDAACDNLFLDYAYCVGVVAIPSTTTTTTTKKSMICLILHIGTNRFARFIT